MKVSQYGSSLAEQLSISEGLCSKEFVINFTCSDTISYQREFIKNISVLQIIMLFTTFIWA
jgi:hypothetical protein